MASFGQELKIPTTCPKSATLLELQKRALKNTKYSRNKTILKIGYLAKAIAHAKAIAFAKWSV